MAARWANVDEMARDCWDVRMLERERGWDSLRIRLLIMVVEDGGGG